MHKSESPEVSTHWVNDVAPSAPIFLEGQPGSGESTVLKQFAEDAARGGANVLICALAAKLVAEYREDVAGIDVSTIHRAFQIPVTGRATARWQMNKALGQYDVIIIDEVSQLSLSVLHHVLSSWERLAKWPVLLLVADFRQLPPPAPQEVPMHHSPRWTHVRKYSLGMDSFRCTGIALQRFLNIVRTRAPSDIDLSEDIEFS